MNKVILFLWFGDEKPPYIQWTLENFRKMNPGWEIRYIEYSTQQILNYKEQGDPVLDSVMQRKTTYSHMNYVADAYRMEYLKQHNTEIVIYCDLDCFPIAPFDNFICSEDKNLPIWIKDVFCKNKYAIKVLGTCCSSRENFNMFKGDVWCIGNNSVITFDKFLQIPKGMTMDESAIFHGGMLMDRQSQKKFNERKKLFHEMKIELGDNFCLPQFTPIEHYYSQERSHINIQPNTI